MKENNTVEVLNLLMKELRIPVSRQSISEEFQKHPEHTTLLAISDLLNNWNIPNSAYQLTFDELTKIPVPFIAHFSNREFVLVNQLNEHGAIVSDPDINYIHINIEEFKKLYWGTILVAEKQELSGEPNYAARRRKEIMNIARIPFVISGTIIIFAIFLFGKSVNFFLFNWHIVLLTIFKTIGLITTILLLIQSIDANNPLIQKLCGGSNNDKDCNAILSSKAAKINDELSWSEVGFFYFSGTWLVLLFSISVQLVQILALINLVSLPYTFFSIYYQWKIIKQWCIFCCVIQFILWLEFLVFLPYLLHKIQLPNLRESGILIIGIILPVIIWVFIKPYLLQAKQITPLKEQLRRFKYNTDLFLKMLNDERAYVLPKDEDSIIIGNHDAEYIITIVSNPYCQPCAKAHQVLEEWINNRDDIKLQVVFTVKNKENDLKTMVASHLMSLRSEKDDSLLKIALNDWYGQKHKDFELWAKDHPLTEQKINVESLEKQKDWCKIALITSTPTIFINGRRLPRPYRAEDIKYFI